MERITKFRGVNEDGRIFYGGFSIHATGQIVQDDDEIALVGKIVKVDEWTGLQDKNKKDIYESDKYQIPVQTDCQHCGITKIGFYVKYNHGSFGLVPINDKHTNPRRLGSIYNRENGIVTGNIHDKKSSYGE